MARRSTASPMPPARWTCKEAHVIVSDKQDQCLGSVCTTIFEQCVDEDGRMMRWMGSQGGLDMTYHAEAESDMEQL